MKRVLLVDDDVDTLEALALILEDQYEIATANNGVGALRLLLARAFDAVVLDLMMPLMDGETLITRMREAGITIPVILASASSDITIIADQLGVEHIYKPYEMSVLEEKLVRLTGATSNPHA